MSVCFKKYYNHIIHSNSDNTVRQEFYSMLTFTQETQLTNYAVVKTVLS